MNGLSGNAFASSAFCAGICFERTYVLKVYSFTNMIKLNERLTSKMKDWLTSEVLILVENEKLIDECRKLDWGPNYVYWDLRSCESHPPARSLKLIYVDEKSFFERNDKYFKMFKYMIGIAPPLLSGCAYVYFNFIS